MTQFNTIKEAHKYLNDNVAKGVNCPCCGQLVKLYKRKLNSIMALGIIRLYQLDKKQPGYHHISKLKAPIICGGDFAKLKFWGLIEERESTDKHKRTSGLWRITSNGVLFTENKLSTSSHITFYNGKIHKKSLEHITIIDALNIHFNYQELMK